MNRNGLTPGGIGLLLVLLLFAVSSCNGDGNAMPPPDAAPFDIHVAAELARLSLYAYQQLNDEADDQTFTLPAPYQLQREFFTTERFAGDIFSSDETVPVGFAATADEAIYIVFRGTVTIYEWIINVTFPQEDYDFVADGGKTHKGFTKVYRSLHDAVVTTVNDLSASGAYSTLYVSGHSLGGALAVLAAPELRDRTVFEPVMYNFGAPRVGDPAFRQSYSTLVTNSWRTVNTNDVVPTLPQQRVISLESYRHVFREHAITFGDAFNDPLDVLSIFSNHEVCSYYSSLCDWTDDPATCKMLAVGVADCHP